MLHLRAPTIVVERHQPDAHPPVVRIRFQDPTTRADLVVVDLDDQETAALLPDEFRSAVR